MLQILARNGTFDVIADHKARAVGIGKHDQAPDLRDLAKQGHLFFIFENSKP